MKPQLLRRIPWYDLLADDNRDPTWLEFVAQVTDEDEVWECRFDPPAAGGAERASGGLVIVRGGVEIATYPPTPERRRMN